MPTTSRDLGLSAATTVADDALAHAAEHLATYMFNHSVRCFLHVGPTARAANLEPGRDYDEEVVFLICLLHDLGMSEIEDGRQRFELDGADMARRFLLEREVAPDRADAVWTGIALHTNNGIAPRFSPEAAVAQAGIFADGAPAGVVPEELVASSERAFPRLDVGYRFTEALFDRIEHHPESASPVNMPGHVRLLGLTPGEGFTLYDMLAAADNGDQPAHRRPGARPAAESPDDLTALFAKRFNNRDLGGLLALYEPEAVLGRSADGLAAGHQDIRDELTALFEQGVTITVGERLKLVRHGRGLALLSHAVELIGADSAVTVLTTTEVVRRQPDGRWLYAIDDPFFSSPAAGPFA